MRRKRPREELEDSWTLGPDEHALLAGKRGATRLGFAVALRFFAREGRFPRPEEGVDGEAVEPPPEVRLDLRPLVVHDAVVGRVP